MSNSVVPLQAVSVYEPRLEVGNQRTWVVVKGGQEVTYQGYPATSDSLSGFNFTCTPPSSSTILDRDIFIEVPVTINFTVNAAISPAPVENLLQPGRDAFRAYPISSVTNNLNANINGFNANIALCDMIHTMSRFHSTLRNKNGWMSKQPSMEDNYQSYKDGDGANNNPLSAYVDSTGMSELGRGAYPFTVVSNTPGSATITALLREQLFLPPFIWNEVNQAGGLANLSNLTFGWTLNSQLARMWSHSDITDVGANSTIGNVIINFAKPTMYCGWITPRLTQSIPSVITYPYYELSAYPTTSTLTLAPNNSTLITSNVLQLSSIPRKMYLYVKQAKNLVLANVKSAISTPDVFTRINSINITWNNRQGVLSGASPVNLYDFSVQNGYNKSWTEFNGTTQQLNSVSGQPTKIIGLEGGVICLEMGKDIGLRDNEAEGVLGNYNLQVTMNITNVNQYATIQPELTVVTVSDGTLVISPGSAMASIGVASHNDVLNAPMSNISYNDMKNVYGGGFFDSFKNFFSKAHDFIKDNKILSTALGALPFGPTQIGSTIAKTFGYGEDARGGIPAGSLYGGQIMSQSDLRARLSANKAHLRGIN